MKVKVEMELELEEPLTMSDDEADDLAERCEEALADVHGVVAAVVTGWENVVVFEGEAP